MGLVGGMFNRSTFDEYDTFEESIIDQLVAIDTELIKMILDYCDELLKTQLSSRQRMANWIETVGDEFRMSDDDLLAVLKFIKKFGEIEYDFKLKNPNWQDLEEYQEP